VAGGGRGDRHKNGSKMEEIQESQKERDNFQSTNNKKIQINITTKKQTKWISSIITRGVLHLNR